MKETQPRSITLDQVGVYRDICEATSKQSLYRQQKSSYRSTNKGKGCVKSGRCVLVYQRETFEEWVERTFGYRILT